RRGAAPGGASPRHPRDPGPRRWLAPRGPPRARQAAARRRPPPRRRARRPGGRAHPRADRDLDAPPRDAPPLHRRPHHPAPRPPRRRAGGAPHPPPQATAGRPAPPAATPLSGAETGAPPRREVILNFADRPRPR